MAQEQNPFELQLQHPWGGMPTITPQQGGLNPVSGGSYFELSPEAMQMMWAPQPTTMMPAQPTTLMPAQPTTMMPAQPQPKPQYAQPTTLQPPQSY